MNKLFLDALSLSVLSSFLIVFVIFIRKFFRKLSKNYICLLWLIVALRLLCTFSFKTEKAFIQSGSYIKRDIYNSFTYSSIIFTDNKVNVTSVLSFVWLIGMMIFLFYFIFSYFSLKRNLRNSYRFKDNIYLTDKYESPFVFGLIKAKVYIPFSTKDEDIDDIILHERAHIKRRDNLSKILAFILLSIYWFNPLMYLSYKLFCKDLEMACDELTTRGLSTAEKEEYALSLLNCAHNNSSITVSSFAENNIKERIERIMKNMKVNRVYVVSFVLISLIISLSCFTSRINIEHYITPMKDAAVCLDQYAYEHHDGVDYEGDNNIVLASMSGKVVGRDDYSILLKHDNGEYTLYSNIENISVCYRYAILS